MKTGIMELGKWKKAAAVSLFLLLSSTCKVWAMMPELPADSGLEEAADEELGEFSDEEWEALMDSYMKDVENDDSGDSVMAETIADPELFMEDAGQGRIRYTLPNRVSFTSNVPEGMVTEQKVFVELSEGAIGTVQKDGEEASLLGDGVLEEAGSYELKLVFFQSPYQEIEDRNLYEVHFSFEIVEEQNNTLDVIHAPELFEISEVYKDGVLQNEEGIQSFSFQEDGSYEIRYRDLATGKIQPVTRFIRDTEAPFLTFSKDITEKRITGPVEFTVSEPDCTVMATFNGNRGPLATNTLTTGGFYVLEVIDRAGNSRTYQFDIRQTYKLFDKTLVIMSLIFFTGLAAWLLYLRKNMRVM